VRSCKVRIVKLNDYYFIQECYDGYNWKTLTAKKTLEAAYEVFETIDGTYAVTITEKSVSYY
jgi:hypothetical protein